MKENALVSLDLFTCGGGTSQHRQINSIHSTVAVVITCVCVLQSEFDVPFKVKAGQIGE